MKKFIYFLQDSPNYPNEIFANSKNEVKNILLESLPSEEFILSIYSEEEMNIKNNKSSGLAGIYSEPDEYNNGKEFFNDVINSAINVSNINQNAIVSNANDDIIMKNNNLNLESPDEVKYFNEGEYSFKLENKKLYKKTWEKVSLLENEKNDYRIINSKTGKIITNDNYEIEKLIWKEI